MRDLSALREGKVAKQRNGPVATVTLTFQEPLTRFENLAPA